MNSTRNDNRLAGFDLLRLLCIIFVIFEHFCETSAHNGFGLAENDSIYGYYLLKFVYSIARVAVPVFIILSGYFLINVTSQKIGKVISLYFMTVFYAIVGIILSYYFGDLNCSIKEFIIYLLFQVIPKNYYLYLYSAVYLLSPFINKGLCNLSKTNYRRLIAVGLLLFSVWSTIINTYEGVTGSESVGMFFTSIYGSAMGFNSINFILLYCLGGYLRLHHTVCKKRDRIMSIFGIVLIALIVSISKIVLPSLSSALCCYDSTLIIFESILLVVFFMTVNLKSNNIISFCGKTTYPIFLFHGSATSIIQIMIPFELPFTFGFFGILLAILIFVFGVYLFSLAFTSLISVFSTPINKIWRRTHLYNFKVFNE